MIPSKSVTAFCIDNFKLFRGCTWCGQSWSRFRALANDVETRVGMLVVGENSAEVNLMLKSLMCTEVKFHSSSKPFFISDSH